MFRRHWSGLPKDAVFPKTLEGLGYFINEDDEIRSIENPDNYFDFFLDKNARVNARQRFEFNSSIALVLHDRFKTAGLEKVLLPLGSSSCDTHMPIFVTPNLETKSRVIVIFGEPTQELGVLAHRVIGGRGGIDKGSMVALIRSIGEQPSTPDDPGSPGIVLANMGETYWWPEEKRAITVSGSAGVPLPSLVHQGKQYVKALNDIPSNEDATAHLKYIFDNVLKTMAAGKLTIDIIAVGASCETAQRFLDAEENWSLWGPRLNAMVLAGTVYPIEDLGNIKFKEFLAKRTRGYILSSDPLDTPLAPPTGNPHENIPELGCPLYSSSEPFYTELILIQAKDAVLAYLQNAAMAAEFENDTIIVSPRPQPEISAEENWETLAEEDKPSLLKLDSEVMKNQVKQYKRWKKFQETGEAPESDSDEEGNEQAAGRHNK